MNIEKRMHTSSIEPYQVCFSSHFFAFEGCEVNDEVNTGNEYRFALIQHLRSALPQNRVVSSGKNVRC